MTDVERWNRYKKYFVFDRNIGISLDVSRMAFPENYLSEMKGKISAASSEMLELEKGALANPDEKRMVGHYWLRNPRLAPTWEIAQAITSCIAAIKDFSGAIHSGAIAPQSGGKFTRFLVIGIGGSALGPQLVADALTSPRDRMRPHFLDNTDPDGIDRVLNEIGDSLPETLCIIISKSGGTRETRNGMLEARNAYAQAGLDFSRHAVAVTAQDSYLDRQAEQDGWVARFPMWDWVGGRTSVTSAVGLLPASLQGFDIDRILEGAKACDDTTRGPDPMKNLSLLLALMWFHAVEGKGKKDMVVLPYKDRLVLFPKYLQQLVMESLGKERDRDGNIVNQGLTVYGNKGSTDQHAYVQQLRDGLDNFFVTFLEVLTDRNKESITVEEGVTTGDYLHGFLLGTKEALTEKGRKSMTLTLELVDEFTLGALIALYERAVGIYASFINVNAYHQPGVEAGKKAAGHVLEVQRMVMRHLEENRGLVVTTDEIASALDLEDEKETIFRLLEHLRTSRHHRVVAEDATDIFDRKYHRA